MFAGIKKPHEYHSYLVRYIYHKPELIQPLINQLNAGSTGAPSCGVSHLYLGELRPFANHPAPSNVAIEHPHQE